jgi:dUTP pyrophosphatase
MSNEVSKNENENAENENGFYNSGRIHSQLVFIKLYNDKCQPRYATKYSACADCYANVAENVTIKPNETVAIPLGFAVNLRRGFRMRLYPRSGLALKNNITLENAPGTIDSDFITEVNAIVHNGGNEDFVVEPLMKICQMDVDQYQPMKFKVVDDIPAKGEVHEGFGSTGNK